MRRSTCPREGASPGLWSSRDWEAGRRPESKISSSLSHSHISFQPSQIILRVKIGGDRGWKLSEVLARPPLRGFQYLLFAAESIRVLFDSASLTVSLGGMSVTYFVRFFCKYVLALKLKIEGHYLNRFAYLKHIWLVFQVQYFFRRHAFHLYQRQGFKNCGIL